MRRPRPPLVLLCVLPALAGARAACAALEDVLIAEVPHVQQKPDFCGEACAEMYLRKLGQTLTQDDVFNASGLDPALGRGCYTRELNAALRKLGFDTGPVWSRHPADGAAQHLTREFEALHADLRRGVPSIVCMHYDGRPQTTEHFRLILGYAAATDEVVYHEPAEADGAYRHMRRAEFLKLWPVGERADRSLIRLRLQPQAEGIRPLDKPEGFSNADYAQHVLSLKDGVLKSRTGFHLVIQPPFVVIGDDPPEAVQRYATRTVKFAVDRLKRDYFKKDPAEILDIWLFKDKASYDKHTRALFHDTPTTPFGYFSSVHKALIMNIATGGGTLVHEIVHPFMRSNFPDCPPWFNEGLASLYEQCGDRDGHLEGYTNWRLAGLQEAIARGGMPTFKELTAMDTDAFYEHDRGTNYSQSRYLCYYLQQQHLLVKFYHAFVAAQHEDSGGYKSLQQVLGEEDMDAFQRKWEKFVAQLKFGG